MKIQTECIQIIVVILGLQSHSLLIDKCSDTKLAPTAIISRSDFFLSVNQFMDNIEYATIKEKSINLEISYFRYSDQDPILFLGKVTEPLLF